MQVRELISGDVVSVEPQTTLREASVAISRASVGALAVVDNGLLHGILTERDIVLACAQGADMDEQVARGWMTSDPDSLDPESSVGEAAEWMLAAGYRHLPVVEDSGPIGMVSIKDVLWALTEDSAT